MRRARTFNVLFFGMLVSAFACTMQTADEVHCDLLDDDDPCTEDVCVQGKPIHRPMPLGETCGSCLIDGVAQAMDAVNPARVCDRCDPTISTTKWSNRSGMVVSGELNDVDFAAIVLADVNGDGFADLAGVSGFNNTLSVLMSTGEGTFEPKTDYALSWVGRTVQAADLNGDQKPDLVATTVDGDNVNVLLNMGDGTFGNHIDYATGFAPGTVQAADVNGDGQIDLVVPNMKSDNVSVLLNAGGGTFAPKVNYVTGAVPTSVAITDLNGDAKPDLVIANAGDDTISVLQNAGGGTFGGKLNYAVGSQPEMVVAADINGDGHTDLAVANSKSDTLSLFFNKGDGTLDIKKDLPTGVQPTSVVATDFNADGHVDLAVTNKGSGTLLRMNNRGDGTFLPLGEYFFDGGCSSSSASDLDGDLRPDLVELNPATRSIHILRSRVACKPGCVIDNRAYAPDAPNPENPCQRCDPMQSANAWSLVADGTTCNPENDCPQAKTCQTGICIGGCAPKCTGLLGLPGAPALEVNGQPAAMVVTDLDGNGALDVAVLDRGNTISVLLNSGKSGVFAAKVDYPTGGVGVTPGSMAAGDFDGDGMVDLIVAEVLTHKLKTFRNLGQGTFGPPIDYLAGSQPSSVSAADLNGDGWLDIVVTNRSSDTLSVLKNTGNGTFAPKVSYAVVTSPSSAAIADFDSDGDMDLAIPSFTNETTSVLFNHGDGTFASNIQYPIGLSESIAAGDLDNDGDVDLALARLVGASVLLNDGQGTFVTAADYLTEPKKTRISMADLDGNGTLDLVATSFDSSSLTVLPNKGNAIFADPIDYFPTQELARPIGLAASDLDGDGTSDLAILNSGDSNVSILRNLTGDGRFAVKKTSGDIALPYDEKFDSIVAGNFNGDDKVDLATSNTSEEIQVFFNGGTAQSFDKYKTFKPGGAQLSALVAADLNGDDLDDLVAVNRYSFYLSVVFNENGGMFKSRVPYPMGTDLRSVIATNLNRDNAPDLVVSLSDANVIRILMNDGHGAFGGKVDYSTGKTPTQLLSGDVNGDHRQDIVVVNEGSATISVFLNRGDGILAPKVDHKMADVPSVALVDVDKDGLDDLALGSVKHVMVLRSLGDGTFGPATSYPTHGIVVAIAAADLNSDGYGDLITTNLAGVANILLNNGDGTFAPHTEYHITRGAGRLVAADVDGDHQIDLAVAGFNSTITTLLNRCLP